MFCHFLHTIEEACEETDRDLKVLGNVKSSHLNFHDILIISASSRIFLIMIIIHFTYLKYKIDIYIKEYGIAGKKKNKIKGKTVMVNRPIVQ